MPWLRCQGALAPMYSGLLGVEGDQTQRLSQADGPSHIHPRQNESFSWALIPKPANIGPLGSQLVVDPKYKTYWQEIERGEAFLDFLDSHKACLTIVKQISNQ